MAAFGEVLFRRDALAVVLARREAAARASIAALPLGLVRRHGASGEAAALARRWAPEPIALELDRAERHRAAANVPARSRGRWTTVRGWSYLYRIPFAGDPALWHARPPGPDGLSAPGGSSADRGIDDAGAEEPPRGELEPAHLVIGLALAADDEARAERHLADTLARVRANLLAQEATLAAFRDRLAVVVAGALDARRAVLEDVVRIARLW